ncbi:agmatinase family protein [uncultured Alistipes sp.]|jgi:agmatinase|uniref:agmatinase family protein n=1 Tax=uncultured Alistipes sp. TaxID=538949 RepID=UPI001F9EFD72|nr:agmatinase family protein [uncultured Alistipes sp.]HJC17101.1 agmatinase family protein [Candidatus Alistipes stercorigallinarum]
MDMKTFDPDGVGVDTGTYFGFPFEPEEAELVLISVPWDVTVSYGAGAAYAPDAIIEASTQLDFHDPLAPGQWRRGIATADVDYSLQEQSQRLRGDAERIIEHLEEGGDPEDESMARKLRRVNEGCAAMNENVREQARRWLGAGKLVGLVGGDHSTPYGLLRALGERYEAFGILHIDAHRDLREAYEGFEYSHASVMYNVLRDVPQVTRLAQVAVRDFSEREALLAERSDRVVSFEDGALAAAEFEGTTWGEQCRRIVATLPPLVYVSFDIDGLSFDNCPDTGTPVNGGLSFNRAVYLLDTLVRSGRRIIGFDVVEVVPRPEARINAITGARVLWKLCGLTLRSNDPGRAGSGRAGE